MLPIAIGIFLGHVGVEACAFVFAAQIIERQRHDTEIAVSDFVQDHNAAPVSLSLTASVILYVGVGGATD